MKRITASLFAFLDQEQTTEVTLMQLIKKIFPSLSHDNMQTIQQWVAQYCKTFDQQQKQVNKKEKKEDQLKRRRVLPSSTLRRVKQIFSTYDEGNKGYLTLDNLKDKFVYGFTHKEVENLFQRHDTDNDCRLLVRDFVRMLLPPDYQIEETDNTVTL